MKASNFDVDSILNALIQDDPELKNHKKELKASLIQCKNKVFARKTVIDKNRVSNIRKKVGLSQSQFANQIGVSTSTLKSWEQGQRNPSGCALKLLNLIEKRPEIIDYL
ncbi:helix-turn-helix domain-containing protein [Taylorella asinigenitalis]|uniref:helix-turn-helix domain-containing protein n=1 Tax=Taylorella asinigenitalis TaxID=84590 RepID=UPI000491C038|nr:helix-turn-helix domain-containing protein [Taylorella asinigenitalis]